MVAVRSQATSGRRGVRGHGAVAPVAPVVPVGPVVPAVGVAVGFGGRTESRGFSRGACTTTPTRSSEVTSTNGATLAMGVSWPGVPRTDVMVPSGTPGT